MSNAPITRIIIHCSDTPATMDIGAKEITAWHTDPKPKGNGWAAIGYHFVIRRDGVVEKGRDLDGDGDVTDEVGAHAYGYNVGSLGICLVGGRPDCNFTTRQWSALEQLVWDLMCQFPEAQVLGHRDVSRKDCPMFDVRAWVKTI